MTLFSSGRLQVYNPKEKMQIHGEMIEISFKDSHLCLTAGSKCNGNGNILIKFNMLQMPVYFF